MVPSATTTSTNGVVAKDRRPRVRRIDSRTKKLARLSGDVARLTLHITRLQQLHQILKEKTMSRAESAVGSLSRTVHTYFDVFRHGYQSQIRSRTENTGAVIHTDAFLSSVMDDDVLGGGFRGVETLREQWKRFSVLFGGLQLRLLNVVVVPLDVSSNEQGGGDGDWHALAIATVVHAGHVTLKTIEILFPHILSDTTLVMSLLGRPVAGDGRTEFVFDCRTGRVIECRIDIDMLGTFARIVEKPSDLVVLFKLAQLTPECFVGDTDCIPHGKAVISSTKMNPESSTDRRDPMSIKAILTEEDDDMYDLAPSDGGNDHDIHCTILP